VVRVAQLGEPGALIGEDRLGVDELVAEPLDPSHGGRDPGEDLALGGCAGEGIPIPGRPVDVRHGRASGHAGVRIDTPS
jgi:hypothetical protein